MRKHGGAIEQAAGRDCWASRGKQVSRPGESAQRGEHGVGIEREVFRRNKRHGDDARVLNAGGDDVHAVGRRRDEDRVLAGAAESAQEKIDAFVGAAGDEHLGGRDAVERGELRDQVGGCGSG